MPSLEPSLDGATVQQKPTCPLERVQRSNGTLHLRDPIYKISSFSIQIDYLKTLPHLILRDGHNALIHWVPKTSFGASINLTFLLIFEALDAVLPIVFLSDFAQNFYGDPLHHHRISQISSSRSLTTSVSSLRLLLSWSDHFSCLATGKFSWLNSAFHS